MVVMLTETQQRLCHDRPDCTAEVPKEAQGRSRVRARNSVSVYRHAVLIVVRSFVLNLSNRKSVKGSTYY